MNQAATFILRLGLLLAAFTLSGCTEPEPLKIGFVGVLTGRHSDLGLYGRNGALMVIEEVNKNGGINGRTVELITRDDKQDQKTSAMVTQQLIDEGVVAIIGNLTSTASIASVPVANREQIVMLSPTTATNQLTGIDDYFLRVMSPNLEANKALARHIFDKRSFKQVVVAYDKQNRAFSKDWADYFVAYAVPLQASVFPLPFSISADSYTLADLAQEALDRQPDSILIVASALDAAMFCQQIRKVNPEVPIFTTMWSMTSDFLQHGGHATEGVIFPNWFDPNHSGERARTFRKKYNERFGNAPTFASYFSYEAATILVEALRVSTNPADIKRIILDKQTFHGTQGHIVIDQFGDAQRDFYIMKVENGKFSILEIE